MILANVNKNKHSSTLLLDIEKAFDTVYRKALIYKMYHVRIPIKLIQIVNSCLNKRKFIVVHDRCCK